MALSIHQTVISACVGAALSMSFSVNAADAKLSKAPKLSASEMFETMTRNTERRVSRCFYTTNAALLRIELGKQPEDYANSIQECIEVGSKGIQADYAWIKPTLKNRKEAQAYLNEFVTSALAILDSSPMQGDDRNHRIYTDRMDRARTDLSKKANLVKLELL